MSIHIGFSPRLPSHDGVATACQAATQKSNSQKITSACVSIFGDATTLNDTNGTHALIGDTNPLQSHGLTIVKPIAISPLTTRDIRVSGRDHRDHPDDPNRAWTSVYELILFGIVVTGLCVLVACWLGCGS